MNLFLIKLRCHLWKRTPLKNCEIKLVLSSLRPAVSRCESLATVISRMWSCRLRIGKIFEGIGCTPKKARPYWPKKRHKNQKRKAREILRRLECGRIEKIWKILLPISVSLESPVSPFNFSYLKSCSLILMFLSEFCEKNQAPLSFWMLLRPTIFLIWPIWR